MRDNALTYRAPARADAGTTGVWGSSGKANGGSWIEVLVDVPEIGGAAELAAVEAELVESCSTKWSTAAALSSGARSRVRSGAGER